MVGGATIPVVRDLVLVGGGHSHVAVLKNLGMKPLAGVRTTLVSPDPLTPYSGMLPGLMAGHYSMEESHVDLVRLARFAGADFMRTSVVSVDPEKRIVHLRDRPSLSFDVLSINTGSTPSMSDVPGAARHAIPVKPVKAFLARWHELEESWRHASRPPVIAVVGGGAGGVELTLSLDYRLKKIMRLNPHARFHLFQRGAELLPTHNRAVRNLMESTLRRRGIEVHLDSAVSKVAEGLLSMDHGEQFMCDAIIWVTHASPPAWIRESGLSVDTDGFLAVGATLSTLSHPYIFGAGDTASVRPYPRPKSGVFAVRQGPPLARNIRLALKGRPLKKFRPQKQFLSLISTGNPYAIASRGPFAFHGEWVWRWKDHIDRTWMAQYFDLPSMESSRDQNLPDPELAGSEVMEKLRSHPMRCSGCGSKVGKSVLTRSLERLLAEASERETRIHNAFQAAEDSAIVSIPPGKKLVQSVDFFPSLVNDPYLFGRILTVHALSDLHAMGAEPHSALINAVIPWQEESRQEHCLTQLLAGVLHELELVNAELLGGHTTESDSLAAGLTVNGVIAPGQAIPKGPLAPSQAIILTKPVGTGVIFAAEMQCRARGRSVEQAIHWMLTGNGPSAGIARSFKAPAMTDLTGFGLLGHLTEMGDFEKLGIDLYLDAVPVIDGALELVEQGFSSSIHPSNLRSRRVITNFSDYSGDARFSLLFDPQTSGGLMIAVPDEKADDLVAALREEGLSKAVVIARTHSGAPGVRIHAEKQGSPA